MKNGVIKIGGLKFTKTSKYENNSSHTIFDTINQYMSPEMLKHGNTVTQNTDNWYRKIFFFYSKNT